MAKRDKPKNEGNRARNRAKNARRSQARFERILDGSKKVNSNPSVKRLPGPHFIQTTAPLSQSIGDVLKDAIEKARA
jgi:hypothetical protein